MAKAGRPATTATQRSVISAPNTLVCALGNAIVWCRDAGGGGAAITPGDRRGRGRAAAGDALAGLAAFGELAGGAAGLPAAPGAQPATRPAPTAAGGAAGPLMPSAPV